MTSSFQNLVLLISLAIAGASTAFTGASMGAFGGTRRSTTLMVRRGRGMGKKKQQKSGGGGPPVNWVAIPGDPWDLTKLEEGKVKMFDTNLITLTDKLTNPDGAVSVLQQNGETFCFSSYCPCCKIPMSKANVLSSTLIACSFCKSAYDLRSGQKSDDKDAGGGGLMAGLAQNLFKASGNTDPLTIYPLGEKDGKTFIGLGQ